MLTRALCRSPASVHPARRACVALLGISAALLLLAPAGVLAHAIIVAAQPAMNSVVAPGEITIRLEFNSRVDSKRSGLVLQAPDGAEAPLALTPGSPPGVLEARAPVKTSGRWKLRWQVLSQDGHITRGEVDFSVRDAIDAD